MWQMSAIRRLICKPVKTPACDITSEFFPARIRKSNLSESHTRTCFHQWQSCLRCGCPTSFSLSKSDDKLKFVGHLIVFFHAVSSYPVQLNKIPVTQNGEPIHA